MRIAPFLISKIFSFAEDMSVGGGTPRAEALLEEKRRVIRNALKGEFIRKKYNPANYTADGGKHLFNCKDRI